jgi:hypothetical protein
MPQLLHPQTLPHAKIKQHKQTGLKELNQWKKYNMIN